MKLDSKKNSYVEVEPYNCLICGELETARYFGNKRMVDKKLCFSCNFWDEYSSPEWLKKSIRINGRHYIVGHNKTPSRWNGHGGIWFKIKMHDGQIIETCDLWHQGEISKYFRDKIIDNAEFVKYHD